MSGFYHELVVLLGQQMSLSCFFAVLMINLEILGIQISENDIKKIFFMFCITLIYVCGTLMVINTLKVFNQHTNLCT